MPFFLISVIANYNIKFYSRILFTIVCPIPAVGMYQYWRQQQQRIAPCQVRASRGDDKYRLQIFSLKMWQGTEPLLYLFFFFFQSLHARVRLYRPARCAMLRSSFNYANLNVAVRENITVLFVSCCRRTILRKFRPTQLVRWFTKYVGRCGSLPVSLACKFSTKHLRTRCSA